MGRKKCTSSQEYKVLTTLVTAGKAGVRSEELNKVCFRYSAVIHNLRHNRGVNILTKKRKGTKLVKFVLLGEAPKKPEPFIPDILVRVNAVLRGTKGAFITTAEVAQVLDAHIPTVSTAINNLKGRGLVESSLRWKAGAGRKPIGYRISAKGGK